jgi:hypothetical protein
MIAKNDRDRPMYELEGKVEDITFHPHFPKVRATALGFLGDHCMVEIMAEPTMGKEEAKKKVEGAARLIGAVVNW